MHIVRFTILSLLLAAVVSFNASAAEDPAVLACSFTTGTAWTYEDGRFNGKSPESISFDILNIDLDHQSAELLAAGADRPATLKIVRAINANHFLEVVNEGFLNLTTIYDKDPATGLYPAVHARHFGLLGQPVVSQYTGSCRDK